MAPNRSEITVGSRIIHSDGTPGTVTSIHAASKAGEPRLIEWVYCGQYRVSGESVVRLQTESDKPRWRR
jgi:hypothetical protein